MKETIVVADIVDLPRLPAMSHNYGHHLACGFLFVLVHDRLGCREVAFAWLNEAGVSVCFSCACGCGCGRGCGCVCVCMSMFQSSAPSTEVCLRRT